MPDEAIMGPEAVLDRPDIPGIQDPLERGGMPATRKRYRLRHPQREAARKRRWKQANAEKNRAHARAAHLKKTFGISVSEYDAMLIAQGGVCAICRGECPTGKRLAVDHDHQTGEIRGLLCFRCNTALARLEEHMEEVRSYLGFRH